MKKYREFEAKTVEDAVELASRELGKKKDEISYDILAYGSTGIFGIVGVKKAKIRVRTDGGGKKGKAPAKKPSAKKARGKKPARQKKPEQEAGGGEEPSEGARAQAEKTAGQAPSPKPKKRRRRKPKKAAAKSEGEDGVKTRVGPGKEAQGRESPEPSTGGEEPPPPLRQPPAAQKTMSPEEARAVGEAAGEAVAVIAGFIMEDPQITVDVSDPERVSVSVEGDDSAVLIGRKGQTLESVGYLVERIVQQKFAMAARVRVDAGGYLARREEELIALARRLGDKVKSTGKPQTLNPLTSQERRVVHMALAGEEGLRTHSKGPGPKKKLVILPAKEG
ncbi:MAG: Jag N-terminal domain-containing protein [Deltaproteobacteria bacterium]|nr:Jag N-terminal domain-containing protein [Deltaproteobacteria bacterium]